MPTITVEHEWQMDAVAEAVALSVESADTSTLWPALEEDAFESQIRHFDARFDQGLRHTPATVRARRRGLGYYGKNRAGERALPDRPFMEWTGNIREATSKFTRTAKDRAEIDFEANYRGPIQKPFRFVRARVGKDRIFSAEKFEKRAEPAVERWVKREGVDPVVRRFGGTG